MLTYWETQSFQKEDFKGVNNRRLLGVPIITGARKKP